NLAKENHMEHRQVLAQSADEFERGRGKMEAGDEQMARRLIDSGGRCIECFVGRDSAMEAKHLLPGQVFQSLKNVNSAVGEVPFLSGMVEEAVSYDQLTAGYREVFELGFRMGYETQKKERMMIESKFTKLKHSLMQKEMGEQRDTSPQADNPGGFVSLHEGPWLNSGLIQSNGRKIPHQVMALQGPIAYQIKQIYWIGLFGLEWEDRIWSEWGPFIHEWHGSLRKPRYPTHCTIMVGEAPCDARKVERDERWRVALNGRKRIKVRAVGIIVGPEGVGVEAKLDPQLYTKAYDMPNATPHITLKVGIGLRDRDVGHMMVRAKASVWVSAEGLVKEGVRMSKDNTLMQIRHSAKLEGEPWEVEVIE